ncbi:MAG: tRNA (adenosine(37)-N6)-threonylcarbamoyltransferase complex dimerization subunit type 1 TsaB [Chlorobi bacterium]|nr:tRNA (adenosine(37)-N6)-threonylcarbamoyltransferase complex dimerization subunit type 1 TsaB [Chlorobiota bacterium]MCI0714752.1 tRNA (adenosine(37)-N6)-threonylcarbamoyltransferase complex dimerization subunit type 1 TsaB [Chlorobiota bacterium]
MNFLLINSSDSSAFAALYKNGEIILSKASDFTDDLNFCKYPDMLVNCINSITKQYGEEINKIDAIAVTIGPGSFTGLRVGLALAKGFAFGLEKKIIPVDNFALTLNRVPEISAQKKYCIVIPSKAPEFYFRVVGDGTVISQGCIEINNLNNFLEKDTIVVGDFADESIIKHCYFEAINVKNSKPEAESMSELALDYLRNKKVFDLEEVEPLYLKDFVIKKKITN